MSSASSCYPSFLTQREYNAYECSRDVPASVSLKQRITIVGAGAVGSYYGARLWEAGYIVTFGMGSTRVVNRMG
jgi:hypothetical protein